MQPFPLPLLFPFGLRTVPYARLVSGQCACLTGWEDWNSRHKTVIIQPSNYVNIFILSKPWLMLITCRSLMHTSAEWPWELLSTSSDFLFNKNFFYKLINQNLCFSLSGENIIYTLGSNYIWVSSSQNYNIFKKWNAHYLNVILPIAYIHVDKCYGLVYYSSPASSKILYDPQVLV